VGGGGRVLGGGKETEADEKLDANTFPLLTHYQCTGANKDDENKVCTPKCQPGGLGITYNDVTINMPLDQGCCLPTPGDEEKLMTNADCQAMCKVLNPNTKWGIR
jgi:hypothetical protein